MTLQSDYGEHQKSNETNRQFHERVYSACAVAAADYVQNTLNVATPTMDPDKQDNRQLRFSRAVLNGDLKTVKAIASVLIGANVHPAATDGAIQTAIDGNFVKLSYLLDLTLDPTPVV